MPYDVRVNKGFRRSVHARAVSVVRWAGRTCVKEIADLMRNSPATGRFYPSRKGDGTLHQASAPGEPPAVDTGSLVRSLGVQVSETDTGGEAIVGSTQPRPIWRWLEYGTSRIQPRPSARPAFFATVDALRNLREKDLAVQATVGPEVR